MGDEDDLKSKFFYHLRERNYNTALRLTKQCITKYRGEICFNLYNALALVLNNSVEKGIQSLESILSENDIKMSALILLTYAKKLNKASKNTKFDVELKEKPNLVEPVDYFYCGLIYYCFQNFDKSLAYIDKALGMKLELADCWAWKGWTLLELKKSEMQMVEGISEAFSHALQIKNGIDAFYGLGEAYLYENKWDDALSVANKMIVRYPNSEVPLVLKMKVHMACQNWDHATEALNRLLAINPKHLEATNLSILMLICCEAKFDEAVLVIRRYVSIFNQLEPNNIWLLHTVKLFAEVCGRNPIILKETLIVIEQIGNIYPENLEIICELGFYSIIENKHKTAVKYFRDALKLESSPRAIVGMAVAEVDMDGISKDILNKIKTFKTGDIVHVLRPYLMFVKAKLCQNSEEALRNLSEVLSQHVDLLKNFPYSENFLKCLNVDCTLQIVKEYLRYIPFYSHVTFKTKTKALNPIAAALEEILKLLHRASPKIIEPLLLLAQLQYHTTGDINSARSNVEMILESEQPPIEAYLLMAQIHIRDETYERAAQCLEEGLSVDFRLRDNPVYHYTNGIVHKKLESLQESIKSFTIALEKTKNNVNLARLSEKAAIYIELIEVNTLLNQTDEAKKMLDEAMEELQGTPEESRILLVCAEQALNSNNINTALALLEKVQETDPYYVYAVKRYADILLEYRNDKQAFLNCYREMIKKQQCVENYMLMGDAYMRVLEPDLAIESYTNALSENPRDPYVNIKLGESLEFAHYYDKAVEFYKEAINLTNNMELKLKLAHLYMQMGKYLKAESLLIGEIESETSNNLDDLTFLRYKTKVLNLLATIQEKSGNMAAALNSLNDAKDNQERIRKRLSIQLTNVPEKEITCLIDIYLKIGQMLVLHNENEKAVSCFNEASKVSPDNVTVLGGLAKLYMQTDSLELCQSTCGSILAIDPDNEQATIIMADTALKKVDFEMALFHFTQLLMKQPNNWNALVRLIEVTRRTGNLETAINFLNSAEKTCENPMKEGGFLYAKALYQWYSGNVNGALRNFNMARQDMEWGLRSIYNMIEICLHPEDDLLAAQFADNDDSEYSDSRSMALKTADRLLKELNQKLVNTNDLYRYKLLCNFRLLAAKDKSSIEQGLEGFLALTSKGIDQIGATLGLCTAYVLLKQSQRAKNILKRLVKYVWTLENAEYLEKCWLLLADYYIQSGKYDMATDLLTRVVKYNKSSKKAHEYLGFIAEKEQKYRDAAANYELAFKYSERNDPSIGYKLSYAFMKSKKFVDAIDVALHVIKMSPDYAPRIKKDILDKSMNNLRV